MRGARKSLVSRSTLLSCLMWAGVVGAGAPPAIGQPAGDPAAPGPRPEPEPVGTVMPRDFADGVKIDWISKTVELEAAVVLRSGPLELFACSPGTREHESVVVVKARPTHIFQAMGLVGFEPGAPIRYDKKNDRVLPAEGDPVELLVRYKKAGEEVVVPAWRWMVRADALDTPPDSLRWVFAGSRRIEGTQLAAETEGTVACVVDFSSALIAVDTPHTADNDALWLMANSEEVPPVGTPCTLIIRRAGETVVQVGLTDSGAMHVAGKRATADDIAARYTAHAAAGKKVTVVLLAKPGVPPLVIRDAVVALRKAGVPRDAIDMKRPDDLKPADPEAEPANPAPKGDGG